MTIYAKLNKARLDLQDTKLNKSGHNKFAGYKYFELGDFLPQVNKIFAEQGLCGVVSFGTELATLTIAETEGDGKIEITSPMAVANLKGCHPIQNLGATETYTRRYLWVTAMEIVEHDAIDATEPVNDTRAARNAPKESAKSITQDAWEKASEEEKEFLTEIAIEVIAEYGNKEIGKAHKLVYLNNLDAEQKTALWSRFNSEIRRELKKFNDEYLKKEGK